MEILFHWENKCFLKQMIIESIRFLAFSYLNISVSLLSWNQNMTTQTDLINYRHEADTVQIIYI